MALDRGTPSGSPDDGFRLRGSAAGLAPSPTGPTRFLRAHTHSDSPSSYGTTPTHRLTRGIRVVLLPRASCFFAFDCVFLFFYDSYSLYIPLLWSSIYHLSFPPPAHIFESGLFRPRPWWSCRCRTQGSGNGWSGWRLSRRFLRKGRVKRAR